MNSVATTPERPGSWVQERILLGMTFRGVPQVPLDALQRGLRGHPGRRPAGARREVLPGPGRHHQPVPDPAVGALDRLRHDDRHRARRRRFHHRCNGGDLRPEGVPRHRAAGDPDRLPRLHDGGHRAHRRPGQALEHDRHLLEQRDPVGALRGGLVRDLLHHRPHARVLRALLRVAGLGALLSPPQEGAARPHRALGDVLDHAPVGARLALHHRADEAPPALVLQPDLPVLLRQRRHRRHLHGHRGERHLPQHLLASSSRGSTSTSTS